MNNSIRVRFAPSPTGPLHIGGLRTALFNYLFAKKNNGSFILRIEDTDKNRYRSGSEEHIIDSLKWCGLEPDESPFKPGRYGPYRQSERREIYKKAIQELIDKKSAYYAFDTKEDLEKYRYECEKKGQVFSYGHENRKGLKNSLNLGEKEVSKMIDSGEPYVIRFKTPANKTIVCEDVLRGSVSVNSNIVDDKILYKSDGMPTYHFANVVDDMAMEITHVIRGEEWLPSLPLHWMIYDAFECPKKPLFVHLPLILKPEGKGKLSKRDGEKFGFPVYATSWKEKNKEEIRGYREFGYLPVSVVNFLSLLGWNPGNEKEIFCLSELINEFDFKGLNKSGARFDPEKNKWFNHCHIQKTENNIFESMINEEFKEAHKTYNNQQTNKIIGLVKPRLETLDDLSKVCGFFYVDPVVFSEKSLKKFKNTNSDEILKSLAMLLENKEDQENLKEHLKALSKEKDWGFGKILGLLRLSIVGDLSGPDLFEIISLIGKETCIKRVLSLISVLEKK
jgi:glutamyl-tRNA synthetase